MTNTADLTTAVISAAREDYRQATGHGTAHFDYAIAGRHDRAEMSLANAVYEIANRGHRDNADARDARAAQLADMLAGDLDAYRARCRTRTYTGWSSWSAGPIRYAR